MILKLAIACFIAYGLYAANQGNYKQVKWCAIGAGCSLALIAMRAWKDWYADSLAQ